MPARRPRTEPPPTSSTVCIVDDDEDVREVLARIVRTVGLEPELYDSAEAYLRGADPSQVACLLLDVQLGGMSGLELLQRLSADGLPYPVFLVSGAHDARTAGHAKRAGAVLVDKPFDSRALAGQILGSLEPARQRAVA